MYCGHAFYNNMKNFNLIIGSDTIINYQGNYSNGLNTFSPFSFRWYCDGSGTISFTNQYDSVTSLKSMFEGCQNFNGPIQQIFNAFPNLDCCVSMFFYCSNFNRSVNIPNTVTDCRSMFANCINLNSYIAISQNAIDCGGMFVNCLSFNQPVDIPDSVKNCSKMFYDCSNFNSYVLMGNNVENCSNMFGRCYKFHPDATIHFPDTITRCSYLFGNVGTGLSSPSEYGRTNLYFEDLSNCTAEGSHAYIIGGVSSHAVTIRDVNFIVNKGVIDSYNNAIHPLLSVIQLENVYISVPDIKNCMLLTTVSTPRWHNVRIDFRGNVVTGSDMFSMIDVFGYGFEYGNSTNVHIYVKSIDDARNALEEFNEAYSNGLIYDADGPTYNGYSYPNGKVKKGWFNIPGGYGWSLGSPLENYTTGVNIYFL